MAPATPTRTGGRGGRQRQSSSLHPPSSFGTAGGHGHHPYATPGTAGGRGGGKVAAAAVGAGTAGLTHEVGGTPFVHPALALATGSTAAAAATTAGMSSVLAAQVRGRRPFNHRNLFARDLQNLMYAYGDAPNPDPDSVTLMEEMTVDFITDLCCRARPSPYALGLGTSAISNSSSAFGATLEQFAAAMAAAGGGGAGGDGTLISNGADLAAGAGAGAGLQRTLPPRAPHRLRVKLEDFRHALRKEVESKKLGRMEQLLYADKVVTEARRVGGVEEAAERAGALQTDNLPPLPAGGLGSNAAAGGGGGARSRRGTTMETGDADDDDKDDNDSDAPGTPRPTSGRGSGRGRGRGSRGGGRGRGRGGGRGKAASKTASARSSVQP